MGHQAALGCAMNCKHGLGLDSQHVDLRIELEEARHGVPGDQRTAGGQRAAEQVQALMTKHPQHALP